MQGTECNMCREGSFYLDPANPKGCTSCFCFGVSHHCHSTHKRRAKVRRASEAFCFSLALLNEEVRGSQVAQWLRICLQNRRREFSSWVGEIPWSRKWQPTPVFLPGKIHGQWRLAGYSPWGCKELYTSSEHI